MLCKLTNTGHGTRVLYDINHVERTLTPGKSLEVDLSDKAARKYHQAMGKGGVIAIEVLEEGAEIALGEAERKDDPKTTFTLRDGDEGHPEAKSLKEARGLAGNQPPPHVVEANLPPPANQPNVAQHAAEQNAKEKVETEVKPEPTTAGELLERLADFNDTDQVRIANTILTKKLPMGPVKPTQIVAALKAQVRRETEQA